MKKGLKKTLAVVIALTMLLSMSVCAFAAELTVTTNYTAGASTVGVVAEVTGANGAEQVAFLAKKGDEIIWIDQQPAVDGTATSTFTTSKSNIGASVSVGTTSLASGSITGSGERTIAIESYTVTVSPTTHGQVTVSALDDDHYVTFTIAPEAGYELDEATATVGGNTTAIEFIGDTKKVAVNADTTFNFTFKQAEKVEITSVPSPSANTVAEDKKSATIAGSAQGAVEYGMLIANVDDADMLSQYNTPEKLAEIDHETASGVRKYQALAADRDGKYIISLKDEAGTFFQTAYKAVLYAVGSNVELSEVFDLVAPESVES